MRTLLTLLTALALVSPGAAIAGNDDAVLIGNEAALSAGAVTATSSDGNALWYNPAGFAQVTRDTVDASGTAFMLRLYHLPRFLDSTNGAHDDGDVMEFVSIPNGLSYVRPTGGGVTAAYGVFVSQQLGLRAESRIVLPDPNTDIAWRIDYATHETLYHAGGGLAWRLNEALRFGVSLFALYGTAGLDVQFSGGATARDGSGLSPGFVLNRARATLTAVGLEARLGLQWDPSPSWSLGLSVRLPSAYIFTDVEVDSTFAEAVVLPDGRSGAAFEPVHQDDTAWGFDIASPARIRLGIAHRFSGGWLSLDVDLQHPLENSTLGVDRDLVFNARVGARLDLSDDVVLGLGAFTDLSRGSRGVEVADASTDFLGATMGVQYGTQHRLAAGEVAESLAFSTTFGLRYAYGFGKIGGVVIGRHDPSAGQVDVTMSEIDLTIHEVGLHLGSALYF